MKNIRYITIVVLFLLMGCANDLTERNDNPNEPTSVPTPTLLINAQYRLVDDIRDEWFSGRMALLWSEYWTQSNYTDEDRYLYRENSNASAWKLIYTDLNDLKTIIDLNVSEDSKGTMSGYGKNENQIAVARILKSWTFLLLTETYGPIPYESYGNDDPTFQALKLKSGIINPVYADQKAIYYDILNELKEASKMIDESAIAFTQGDNIFHGNAGKWKRLANSLVLRAAMRIRGVDPEIANKAFQDAVTRGVMQSVDDDALFKGENNASNAAPFYKSFAVSNRTDFTMAKPFIDLLKGSVGPFNIVDPRLYFYAAPIGATAINNTGGKAISQGDYLPVASDELGSGIYIPENYEGMPYGLDSKSTGSIGYNNVSLPNAPMQATFGNPFMDYAEVCFLLSEFNDWDQTYYEKGVRASMVRWGVQEKDIKDYIDQLPPASQETVLTQKYIALYMQPYNAWAEYRRTGFPKTLIKPGEVTFVDAEGVIDENQKGKEYYFISLVNDVQDDLPRRVKFSNEEPLLNPQGYQSGVEGLSSSVTAKLVAKSFPIQRPVLSPHTYQTNPTTSSSGGQDLMSTKLWWELE
ncbi:SusD/RagB family nutrient-binding outer membrane lipoprotein [Halosquirtibacter laminarini]|uniref:SusD/RagB family nutrient-binding outer membrane lipoprotein n=1 Tax=Halosquirtibacter laminarini TaxID=3374600 RepID=A0AC61NQE0_9BACT|nr:SusD/RagB family nutrient-binding outer membrane lipoprotein [Prolixibacteraceae bacterium]